MIAGRVLTELSNAIDNVQNYHQVESARNVRDTLVDVKRNLSQLLRLANVTDKALADLEIVSDFTYAKKLIMSYTPLIHELVANRPSVCLLLRATFLKLTSILNAPLVRINQSESKDVESVAEYYSGDLLKYVRHVLDVVPRSVFQILDKITLINTSRLKVCH